jgi:hypothetical protein
VNLIPHFIFVFLLFIYFFFCCCFKTSPNDRSTKLSFVINPYITKYFDVYHSLSVSSKVQYCRYLRIIIYENYYPVLFIRKVCKCNICLTGKMKSYGLGITIWLKFYKTVKPLWLNTFHVLHNKITTINSQKVSRRLNKNYEYVYILEKEKFIRVGIPVK